MNILKKEILAGKGFGWLKASVILWVVSLILIAADLALRIYSTGYREWWLAHLPKEDMCCVITPDTEWAMRVFSIVAGTAIVCIVTMFAVALIVSALRKKASITGLTIAIVTNIATLWLTGDSAYFALTDPFLAPSPDFFSIGLTGMLAAIEAGAIGILLISINYRKEEGVAAVT